MNLNENTTEFWNPLISAAINGNEFLWKRAGSISAIREALTQFIHAALLNYGREPFEKGRKNYNADRLIYSDNTELGIDNKLRSALVAMKDPVVKFINQSQIWKLVPAEAKWNDVIVTLLGTHVFARVLDRMIITKFSNNLDLVKESFLVEGTKNQKYRNMDLVIEVPANSTRKGVGPDGPWEKKVLSSYGYMKNTSSPDGEELDFWLAVNPDPDAKIFVIHQMTYDGKKYDEDKVMLGFKTKNQAEKAYKAEMPNPEKQFGGITEFSPDHFAVIAYQARKSSGILTTEDNFQKMKSKGYLKSGIKSPVQISKLVSENLSLLMKSTAIYLNENELGDIMEPIIMNIDPTLSDKVVKLINGWSIDATVNGNVVYFSSSDDLDRYLNLIDDNGLDVKLQGDLSGNRSIQETTNTDLVGKISKELADSLKRSTGGVWTDQFYGIVEKYVDVDKLSDDDLSTFMNQVIQQFKLENNGMEPYELDAMNANDHPDEFFTKGVNFTESGIDDNYIRKIAFELSTNLGNYIPDGEWTDCLDVILQNHRLGNMNTVDAQLLNKIIDWFKKDNGGQEPSDVMADMWDSYAEGHPEDMGTNPYRVEEDTTFMEPVQSKPETGEFSVIVHLQPFRNGGTEEYPFWLPENAKEEILKTDLTESQASKFVEDFLNTGSYMESNIPGKKTQVLGIQIIDNITYLNKFGKSFKLTESKETVNEIDILAGIKDKNKNQSNFPSFTDLKKLIK